MNEGWQELANAVVLQAVKDYRKVLWILKRHPKHKMALDAKAEIEDFFHSSWFDTLCKLDGEMVLQKLQKEAVK